MEAPRSCWLLFSGSNLSIGPTRVFSSFLAAVSVFCLSVQALRWAQSTGQEPFLLPPPPTRPPASVHCGVTCEAPAMFKSECGAREEESGWIPTLVCPGSFASLPPASPDAGKSRAEVEKEGHSGPSLLVAPPLLYDPLSFPALTSAHQGSPRPQRSPCLGLGAWGFSAAHRTTSQFANGNPSAHSDAKRHGGKDLPVDITTILAQGWKPNLLFCRIYRIIMELPITYRRRNLQDAKSSGIKQSRTRKRC